MKKLFAAILILSIISFQFSELLVYAAFKLNQDYIAKNLCVEKDIENSTCKGCCQLKKKVDEQQKQKKKLPPIKNEKTNITFYQQGKALKLDIYSAALYLINRNVNELQFFIHCSIFHPPEKRI